MVDNDDFDRINKYRWYLTDQGYAKRRVFPENQKSFLILMHREIMSAPKGSILDHKNLNRLDNRKTNLRFCTKSQNSINRGKRCDNTSGYRGIHWNKNAKRWFAKLILNGKEITKYATSKREAIKLYRIMADRYFGEFNFKKN